MKILKRDGREVDYDEKKIISAIAKANDEVGKENSKAMLSGKMIDAIAEEVGNELKHFSYTPKVEDIQDLVENKLIKYGAAVVAKKYIKYRYIHELLRQKNTTDDAILSLVECQNEDINQENSNKNPVINSTQRDYIAGETSKDLAMRVLLPKDIVEAHEQGLIHFHDADYFLQHMHNCGVINLEDCLQNSTVVSKTQIDNPKSFLTACNIATQIIAQVASNQYGLTMTAVL